MRELIERLCWFLAYTEQMDVPVPRELAVRAVEQWTRHEEHGAPPRPADAEGTSPDVSNQGERKGVGSSNTTLSRDAYVSPAGVMQPRPGVNREER